MNSVHTPVEPDRRHWHLDKTLNISHLLTTLVIAGSLFAYANNMDRRVAILEEKMHGFWIKWGISEKKMHDFRVRSGIPEEKMHHFWVTWGIPEEK